VTGRRLHGAPPRRAPAPSRLRLAVPPRLLSAADGSWHPGGPEVATRSDTSHTRRTRRLPGVALPVLPAHSWIPRASTSGSPTPQTLGLTWSWVGDKLLATCLRGCGVSRFLPPPALPPASDPIRRRHIPSLVPCSSSYSRAPGIPSAHWPPSPAPSRRRASRPPPPPLRGGHTRLNSLRWPSLRSRHCSSPGPRAGRGCPVARDAVGGRLVRGDPPSSPVRSSPSVAARSWAVLVRGACCPGARGNPVVGDGGVNGRDAARGCGIRSTGPSRTSSRLRSRGSSSTVVVTGDPVARAGHVVGARAGHTSPSCRPVWSCYLADSPGGCGKKPVCSCATILACHGLPSQHARSTHDAATLKRIPCVHLSRVLSVLLIPPLLVVTAPPLCQSGRHTFLRLGCSPCLHTRPSGCPYELVPSALAVVSGTHPPRSRAAGRTSAPPGIPHRCRRRLADPRRSCASVVLALARRPASACGPPHLWAALAVLGVVVRALPLG